MKASNEPAATPGARERILFAAHELFYREGIRATGIDRVIAESGVAKLSFYRHYPSKNDLVLAFLDIGTRAGWPGSRTRWRAMAARQRP
jgi:AcrR family transcriptional regulator